MTHTPAQAVKQYLVDQALVVEPGDSGSWPAFVSHLPDDVSVPDNAVCLYDTTGSKDGRPMGGLPLFHHGIQLRIRCTAYQTGFVKAQALADALAGISNETVEISGSSYIIQSVTQSTSVVPLGVEEGTKRRDHFTVNFLVTLKEE